MPDELNLIGAGGPLRPTKVAGVQPSGRPAAGADFKTMLLESIDQVDRLRHESDTAIENLATGQTENVAEVFSAVRKADVAFTLMMEIKNRMLDAYTELRQLRF